MKRRTLRLCQSEGGMPLIIPSNPHCNMPAGQAHVGGSGATMAVLHVALSHISLTQVGRRLIPGWKSSRPVSDSHQPKFTSFSPHNLFLFKHNFVLFERQSSLAQKAVALIPCYPKTSFILFFHLFVKVDFSEMNSECFSILFSFLFHKTPMTAKDLVQLLFKTQTVSGRLRAC